MSLYFTLLLGSVSVPLLLSFDKRLQFYKRWKYVFPSVLLVASVYVIFDIFLTKNGVWGFNPLYISGVDVFWLPVEEVLFFIAIPYASIFLHDAFVEYFPRFHPGRKLTYLITSVLMVVSISVILFNLDKTYTVYIFSKVFIVLLFSLFDKSYAISRFYVTFLIILIPFVIVNGVLTGTGIDSEVVWYNDTENTGLRFFTIPLEDFGYAFSLILFNLLLIEQLKGISWSVIKRKMKTFNEFLKNNVKYVFFFFTIFYLVGIAGMVFSFSFPIFKKLVPFALLLSAAGLFIYHEKFESKSLIIYGIVFLTSFVFEWIGVATGVIFGSYYYGESLGLKVMNTPLMIGLNWLMLVYMTAEISRKWIPVKFLQIPAGALLMVGYDVILEQVAPKLGMWYWIDENVPLQNYLAWFILAFFFHSLFRAFNLKTFNKLALFMFLCQTLFFLILYIFFEIFH